MVLSESSSWASLPMKLLLLILDGLMGSFNYLSFGVVCKSWFSAAISQKERRIRECHKQVPMLMVPTKDRSHIRRSLYNLTHNKVLDCQLLVPYRGRCCGSCYGWLATTDPDVGITLLNPFSGKTIKLPPVTHPPTGVKYTKRDPFRYEFEVGKVVLSNDPSLMPNDFVVVAMYTIHKKLAYIKPGQKSWTYIDYTNNSRNFANTHLFVDVIFYKGKIYAVDCYGAVISVDVSGCKPEVTEVVPRTRTDAPRVYIVESSHGELLLVQRNLVEKDHPTQYVTVNFKIFKLLGVNEEVGRCTKRVEIDSLGEDALFLGDNYSTSVLASGFSGCQANCIYYTDDYIDFVYDFPLGFRDTGIYYLEDASFGSHYKMKNRHRRMPPAIWIAPYPHI